MAKQALQKVSFTYKKAAFAGWDSGKGKAVLFLHGFLENKGMWVPLVEKLPKKYRALALDLPGHGASANLGYVHTMEAMADVAHAFVKKQKLRKLIVVGHSMGGYVALALAEKYPQLVKGIVLLNSSARADSAERKINRDRAISLVKRNYKSYVRKAVPLLFRPKSRVRLRAVVNAVKQEALQTSKQGIIAALEGMKIRPDREVLLHFGSFPCLVIAGKKDPIIPLETIQEQVIFSKLPHLFLPNGHMSHLEDFEEMHHGLLRFLAQIK
jgi:pimeloyl-ACP methyl ester carboxylesterase